jgi:hypothetical protein
MVKALALFSLFLLLTPNHQVQHDDVSGWTPGTPKPTPESNRRWFKIVTADGTQIGHGWNQQRVVDGQRISTQHQILKTREFRHSTRLVTETTTRITGADGRLVEIENISRIDREVNRIRVKIQGDVAEVERTGRAGARRMTVALPANTQFDGGDALIRAWDFDRTPKLTFQAFSLSALAVERVEVVRAPKDRSFYRYSYDGPYLRAATMITRGADGRLVASQQKLFGTAISLVPTSQTDAEKDTPPFSPLQTGRIKSPYKIGQAALEGQIRYRFRFNQAVPFPLPQTGEQRMRIDGDELVVDVCKTCGPAQTLTAEERADALRPTLWMQYDHPRLEKIAKAFRNRAVPDAEKMNMLAKAARQKLQIIDFAGHYSAADAIMRRRGDCSEDAVVLAALGRAVGIPTRVVSGLAYARERYHGVSHSFLPHSWTIAWIDGRWQSFDMSLGAFDAAHIAFSMGDGDPRAITSSDQLAGLVDWVSMVEVKKREMIK